ncbi:9763_t:CDS:10 [Dentiscutata erythropus]|uniref:asparaginase n=1 Tax=Dentiscutata erythropus TaxID=1348616 RepID=A0A9N9A739_9GLOM|nr:9763_t:CDS:10 [Dentiscutata erythropus]
MNNQNFNLTEQKQINGDKDYFYKDLSLKRQRCESKDSSSEEDQSMKTTFTGFSECSMEQGETETKINQPTIHNDAVSVAMQMTHEPDISTVPDLSQVLVIYTGGTIGMKNTYLNGYIPAPNYFTNTLAEMSRFHDQEYFDKTLKQYDLNNEDEESQYTTKIFIKDYWGIEESGILSISSRILVTPPSFQGKRIKYSIVEYEPLLDSCNMISDDWVRIATDIELNYQSFDAFIILHGTDTMAYTASALSFLLENLGKTVILTGSQVPISEVRNDAVENLLGALTIAGHYVIPEVCLFFNNKLFRGNRAVKMNAVEFNAFDSPNLSPLATVGINIHVNWGEIVRPSAISKFLVHKNLNRNVSNLRLFPGITESTVRALLAPPIEGVILETYGAGNAPDTRDDIMRTLNEAAARGIVIVNCTQCKKGTVTDIYATGKALAKVGVVPGNDMTPECALVKLSYLLGYRNELGEKYSPDAVRVLMTKNMRGELTVLAPKPRYTFHNRTHKIIQNMIAAAVDSRQGSLDSALMINVQEKVLLEKSLYPILLCSAAGTDDLEGLQLLWDSYDGLVLNCIDYDGRTPLHIACTGGYHKIVRFLLEHGASVHMRDRFGHTPLYEAARNKRRDVINILREAGAHFNESELDDVMFQVLSAAAKGDQELLNHFVDAGMDINKTGFDHRTALHHAVAEGRVSTVQYLLSLPQIKVETKDRWGRKPIDDAETNLGRMWGRDGNRMKELEEIYILILYNAEGFERY